VLEQRAPLIETPRLRLRSHAEGDFDACAAMWADPEVTRFIGAGAASTLQQSWARMRGYIGLWEYLGFGYWAIEERATGRYIGECGFADFKRDVAASMRDVPELGWALVASAHGKGFATEAVLAATAWGDAHLLSDRTVCMIDAENRASVRVAEKCGFSQFDSSLLGETSALFFERRRNVSKQE
jgi:RimJ/RimL family protein N-acetyltransferase